MDENEQVDEQLNMQCLLDEAAIGPRHSRRRREEQQFKNLTARIAQVQVQTEGLDAVTDDDVRQNLAIAAKQGWGVWLAQFPWNNFVTLTFRDYINYVSANSPCSRSVYAKAGRFNLEQGPKTVPCEIKRDHIHETPGAQKSLFAFQDFQNTLSEAGVFSFGVEEYGHENGRRHWHLLCSSPDATGNLGIDLGLAIHAQNSGFVHRYDDIKKVEKGVEYAIKYVTKEAGRFDVGLGYLGNVRGSG